MADAAGASVVWPHLKSIRLTMEMVTVIFSIRVDEVTLHLHGE